MKTLKLLTVLFATSLMLNCSNDDSTDPPQNQQPEETNLRLKTYGINAGEYNLAYNSNGYLSNYQSLNNTINLVYDSENRLIQMSGSVYTYNSQGRIATISTSDDVEATLVYNNEGLLATCNFHFPESGSTKYISRVYEYNSNNQLISTTEIDNADSFYWRELLTYDSRGNIAQKTIQYGSDITNLTNDSTTSYTYDDKKNPGYEALKKMGISSNFALINLYPLYTLITGNYVHVRAYYYSPNNLLSKQTGTSNTTYDYVYNDEGFPISCERTLSSGTTTYYSWFYETY